MRTMFILILFGMLAFGENMNIKVDTIKGEEKEIGALIDQLVQKLSKMRGLWVNGLYQEIKLPSSAKVEEVVSKYFEISNFNEGKVKNYKILSKKKVTIDNEIYDAVLVDIVLGKRIILLQFQKTYWWNKIFDAGKTNK